MVEFISLIKKFSQKAEKTGWSYIEVPSQLANQLKPDTKVSFRVKGTLDNHQITGISLVPMGEGNYIMPLNAQIRKAIRKEKGAILVVKLEVDTSEYHLNEEFLECLQDDPSALKYFRSLPISHQRYFSKWIDSAKTIDTKIKRITMSVKALAMNLGYGEMIRMNKKKSEPFD